MEVPPARSVRPTFSVRRAFAKMDVEAIIVSQPSATALHGKVLPIAVAIMTIQTRAALTAVIARRPIPAINGVDVF